MIDDVYAEVGGRFIVRAKKIKEEFRLKNPEYRGNYKKIYLCNNAEKSWSFWKKFRNSIHRYRWWTTCDYSTNDMFICEEWLR